MLDVSLTLIVLNAKLPCWLWRTQTNNDDENRINTKTVTLFQNRTQTFNFCRSLGYVHGNMSIIFFNDLCKPIRIYIYARKKHFYKLSCSKASKTQQICGYKHTRKNSKLFQWHRTGIEFMPRNNFANLVSLAKVSIPVRSIIPCSAVVLIWG